MFKDQVDELPKFVLWFPSTFDAKQLWKYCPPFKNTAETLYVLAQQSVYLSLVIL